MSIGLGDILGNEQKSTEKKMPVADQPTVEGMTAEDYVHHVTMLEQFSMRAVQPRRMEWDRSWNLYNMVNDFSTKSEWQSKNAIPKINMTVRSAVFMVKRSLMGPVKSFTVDGYGEFGKMAAYYVDKLAQQHLENANYVTGITDSLHAGMLSSLMVLKVYPRYEDAYDVRIDPRAQPMTSMASSVKERLYKKLNIRVDPVDPYKMHLDPSGGNKYKIQEMEMDLYDLVELAKDPKNGFDKAVVAEIHESFKPQDQSETTPPEQREGTLPDSKEPPSKQTVFLQEFWGDVWDRENNLIGRRITYTVANRKYLVKKPVKDLLPLACGPDPFIISPIVRKPFSVWHQGFVEVVSGLQIIMTELLNLMVDANFFASAKAFEIDIDMVHDPNEFINGIYPGKTFKKRGGGFSNTPMIRDISIGNVSGQSLSLYNAIQSEFDNGTGLSEFLQPASRSRSRTTATEVMEKSNASTSFMEEIGKTVEEGVIEPLLDKLFHYIVEYQINFDDPHTMDMFNPDDAMRFELMMRNPAFRSAMHKAPLKFKARGLSTMVARMRELDKVERFVGLAMKNPTIAAKLNIDKVLQRYVEGLGWYPHDVLAEMDKAPDRAPLMQQQPIQGPGGMRPLMPSAPQLSGMAANGASQILGPIMANGGM